MRHLFVAALMIVGSLLTVQTTIGTLEWLATRGHQLEEAASPFLQSSAREAPAALHLPALAGFRGNYL